MARQRALSPALSQGEGDGILARCFPVLEQRIFRVSG
jgi:hypothetical protein